MSALPRVPAPVVGVVGLGRMGAPIAARLADASYETLGFDVDPLRAEVVTRSDVRWCASAERLAGAVDVLVTVLPGPRELEESMLGGAGCAMRLRPASCWIDLTSSDPRVNTRIADALSIRGVESVAAPMAGGPSDASAGRLRCFVGGPTRAVARAIPLLECLTVRDGLDIVGTSVAAAQTTKLLANLLWFGQVVAVTEAMLLGQRLGLDSGRLRQSLASSAGGSKFIDVHLDALLRGDYLEEFGLDRCVEELLTLRSLAAEAGVPFTLSTLVARLHEEALDAFGPIAGELLVARLLEDRAGDRLRYGRVE